MNSFLSDKQIAVIEHNYKATYVADLPIKDKFGKWANMPVAIFYTETAHEVSNSHYFGFFFDKGTAFTDPVPFITSGQSAVERTIIGVEADNGQIIHSPYRHCMVQSDDRSVYIDGGADYTKTNSPRYRYGKVVKDKLLWSIEP